MFRIPISSKLNSIVEFLTKQGLTMAGNIVYGLLCVRLLPIAEYAKFVVVFGIQGTLVVLMDVGITGTLVPLVGAEVNNHKLIADYVASLRKLARLLYVALVPVVCVAVPLIVRRRSWDAKLVVFMVVVVLCSTWLARVASCYGAVLIIRRDRKRWYRAQLISSFGTLALLLVFWPAHLLNAYSAIVINVAGIGWVAVSNFTRARTLLGVVGTASREKCAAMIKLALPSIPGVVFYAVQGQLAVLLMAVFGRTAAVAGIGALGRLGQLFGLFSQANPVLVEPYFARLPRAKLRENYLLAIASAASLGTLMLWVCHLWPNLFLWVLGPQYKTFRFEVQQVILSGSLSLLSGLLASMNGARRFNYYWHNFGTIITTLALQAYFICRSDLSSMRTVLWMNVVLNLSSVLINSLCALFGFIQGPRRIAELDAIETVETYE